MIIAPVSIISNYLVFALGLGDQIELDKKAKALSVFTVVSVSNNTWELRLKVFSSLKRSHE